jgi:hypothetical protein
VTNGALFTLPSLVNVSLPIFLEDMRNNKKYVRGASGLGGEERIRKLEQVLQELQKREISLWVLSTSWGHINASNWAAFIAKYFEIASPILARAFPIERIIALNDPGESIAADKAATALDFLSALGWNRHNGLLVDDSPSNIAKAEGKLDWLQVAPREGLAPDALDFLAKRARASSPTAVVSKKIVEVAARRTLPNKRTQSVSILVTRTSAYCKAAAPTEEILKRLRTPVPLPDWKLFFYRADVKLQKRYGDPEIGVSNAQGRIHIDLDLLPANVIYCVVQETKSEALVISANNDHTKYDRKCLEEEHASCDFILTAENATVSMNFPSYCSWGTPCVHYSGPFPV